MTLSGVNTYTGATAVDAGVLQAGSGNAFGDNSAVSVSAGATLALNNFSNAIGSLAGAGSVTLGSATLTTGGNDTSTTFSGVMSGTGGLTKTGTGTMTLLGASTYTGSTTVTGGTLQIGAGGSLQGTGGLHTAVMVNSGGTLSALAGSTVLFSTMTIAAGGEATNAGTMQGFAGTFNNSGIYTSTGTLIDATDINNRAGGVMNMSGTMSAPVVNNDGQMTVNGNLAGPITTFNNQGTGGLTITAGTFSDITTLNNTSTAPIGVKVNIGTGLTVTGTVTNAAGSTFEVGGALAAGAFTNNGSTTVSGTMAVTGAVTISGGTLDNTGTVTAASYTQDSTAGASTNSGTLTLTGAMAVSAGSFANNGGTINAASMTNSATFTNSGTLTTTGGSINSGTYTQSGAASVLTGGFVNTGTATVSGGAVNGAISNFGNYNVTGTVTSDSTFTNDITGTLAIGAAGNYTVAGLLTNSNLLVVAAGGVLTADGITNNAGATITNNGTITDVLNNAGTVTNNGIYNAIVASNTGTISNTTGATWNGAVTSSTGTLNNTGTWTGDITNSGILNQSAGSIVGNLINSGTVNGSGGSIVGTVANSGNFNLSGSMSGVTTFTNTGFLNYSNMPVLGASTFTNNGTIATNSPTAQLTITGALTGTGTINSVANGTNVSLVTVGGSSSGSQNIYFTNAAPGAATPVFSTPKTVLDLNGGSLVVGNKGVVPQLSNGLFNSFLLQNGPGTDGFLQTMFNSGPISGVAASISSIVASLTSGFFQPASTFVPRPVDPKENQISGGPFVRINSGGSTTTLGSATNAFGINSASSTNGTTNFSGFQAGLDVGIYNAADSGWNVNLGFFGGVADASTNSITTTPVPYGSASTTSTQVAVTVPHVALYSVVSRGSFVAEINVRKDFYSGTVSSFTSQAGLGNVYVVAPNSLLTGTGISVNVDLSNRFDLSDHVYVEPLLGLTYGNYSFNNLYFNQALSSTGTSGLMSFQPIESWLGRIGANLGGTFMASDNIALAPFVHASVWREFVGNDIVNAYVNNSGSSFNFAVNSDRVGTFGQIGAGVQFKLLDFGLLGFIRGDLRFGNALNGQAVNIGFRKQF